MSTSNSGPLFNEGDLNPAPATMSSERRRVARASVMIPVRLRPVRFTDGNFEDVTSTVNVARGCLYVTTWRDSYYPGMRVWSPIPTFRRASRTAGSIWAR